VVEWYLMTKDEFKEFKKEKSAFYKTIVSVQCSILNEQVVFNSKGFYHLRYDSHGKERLVKEQVYKMGLLPLVIPVIKNATAIYEYKKQEYSKPLGKYFEIWELRMLVGEKSPAIQSY
jgi:hypothetical protein